MLSVVSHSSVFQFFYIIILYLLNVSINFLSPSLLFFDLFLIPFSLSTNYTLVIRISNNVLCDNLFNFNM